MLNKAEKQEIEIIVSNILKKKVFFYCSLAVLIFGGSMYGIYLEIRKIIIEKVVEQFNEPKIQEILQEVASNEAKNIIENRLNPEISRSNRLITENRSQLESEIREVKKETEYFRDYLEGKKLSFSKEFDTLKEQVDFLKQRNMLTSLADEAISSGSSRAFEELKKIQVARELENAKSSELSRIYNFYAVMTRIEGVSIAATDPNGTRAVDKEISTDVLLNDLVNHSDWQIRAKAAELLKDRKEEGVSDLLLDAAKNDPRLDVRKIAHKSFAILNGIKSPDVFDVECTIELLQKKKDVPQSNQK